MKSALRLTCILVNTAPFSTRAFGAALSGSPSRAAARSARRAPRGAGRGGRRAAQLRSWPSTRRAMRERHVERVAHVVVERVAGEVAGVAALEQGLEVGEGAARAAPDRCRDSARRNSAITASRTRTGSSTLTRLVTSFWLRRSCIALPLNAVDYSPPQPAGKAKLQGKDKWEPAGKPGSVAPAGVTRWGRQPFLWAPGYPGALATYPQARPSRPYGVLPRRACLFGVAPDGGCRVSPLDLAAGTRLCGPLRHVAVPGSYPASRSAEPGLSSALAYSGCLADSRCILPRRPEVARVVVERAASCAAPARVAEDRQRREVARRRAGRSAAEPVARLRHRDPRRQRRRSPCR